ncbi:MAG TPA: LysR family transcriptional regulator [Acidimicrobiia bacterium]|nr:LysR family transcriptional regulator [Acidimicrobiia bacterium]
MDLGQDINLQRLRVFLTVVDRRGYTAAAGMLGMTQPSVSYHVKALERDLGVELMVYRNRSIHLTAEGEEVYRAAKIILSEGERLGETIQRMRGGQSGRIALGASIAFEHQFFFDLVIAPFVKEHREVHVSLRFGHSLDLVEAVSTGSLDMAYVNDWRIPSELEFEFLHSSDLVFLVPADHPLASRSTVSPEDIDVAGLIVAPIESGEVISYHEMLRRAGIRNPRTTVEVDGIQPRKLAAQAGLGVLATFAPAYAGDHAMDPLRTLRLTGDAPEIDFGVVTRKHQPWTPLMDEFGARLRSVIA